MFVIGEIAAVGSSIEYLDFSPTVDSVCAMRMAIHGCAGKSAKFCTKTERGDARRSCRHRLKSLYIFQLRVIVNIR
jgi:hypothetical protein